MTLGLDLDMDFSNEITRDRYVGPNGNTPRGFYGAGLMAAPFVAIFSVIDRMAGAAVIDDRDQFLHTWSYFGFSAAVQVYFLLSIVFFWRSANALGTSLPKAAIVLFCFSSGVLYFVFVRPRMPHAFEFFALSLVTYASVRLWEELKNGRPCLVWGSVAAFAANLCVSVHMNDANVALLPILFCLMMLCLERDGKIDGEARRGWFRMTGGYLLLVGLFYIPFGILNFAFFDTAFPMPRDIYGGDFVLPEVNRIDAAFETFRTWLSALPSTGTVLFGAEFGLLYTNPVAVIGTAAIMATLAGAAVRGRTLAPTIAIGAVAVYVLFSLSFVLLWRSTGSSYGYRYLYPLFPIGFLGYLLWWSRANGTAVRRLAHWACLALCVFSIIGQVLFTKTEALSYRIGTTSLGRVAATAPDFNTNLLSEAINAKAWNKVLKDGVFGYVNKMYVNRTYFRWKADQVFHGGAKGAREPNWQHPDQVAWFMLVLCVAWIVMLRRFTSGSG